MKKKMMCFLLTLVLALGMLAGCSGGTKGSETTAAATGTQGSSGETQAAGSGETQPAGRTDLNVALTAAVTDWDPLYTIANQQVWVFRQIFSSLIKFKESGSEPVCDAAESYTFSEDGMSVTFKIREGITFHDGSVLNAEDVKFSYEEAAKNAYMGDYLKFIDHIEQDGDYTLTFYFTYPNKSALTSMSLIYIVPSDVYTELGSDGFGKVLIGSGPFKFENTDEATGEINLVRNDDYFGEPSRLERIHYEVISEESTRIISLENGEVDFITFSNGNYDTIAANSSINIGSCPTNYMAYFGFNTAVEPTNNLNFRKALAYALDYETITLIASGGNGAKVNPIFYLSNWSDFPEGAQEYHYDPELAKQYLAAAGIETPFDLGTMELTSNAEDVCVVIQQNLADIGVNIKLATVEGQTYIGNMLQGNYYITFMGSASGGYDDVMALTALLSSGGSMNLSFYSNPELDALLEQMAALEVGTPERAKVVADAVAIIQEELPVVNLYEEEKLYASAEKLVTMPNIDQNFDFADFYWE